MSPLPERQETPGPARWKILVVDDEPTLRLGFAYALTNERTTADVAADGAEALRQIKRNTYDAVVMDLRMPEIDGLSVVQRMRELEIGTPVVLCSAYITVQSALIAIRNQVADFLIKPVKPNELRKAVASVLEDDSSVLGRSLAAIRANRLDHAIALLEESQSPPGSREEKWLTILQALVLNSRSLSDIAREFDDSILSALAFNNGAT